jgi:predicted transcriptional regulator
MKKYWERRHRMNILTIVIEKAGDTGMTPTQIYDQMNVGVQYNVIAKAIAVLYRSGFLSRCVSLGVDARVYKYRATKQGHEVYLNQSFDEASRLERSRLMIFKVVKI